MARLIESSLWVDFTRGKSPLALKTMIHPWILDPLACLCEPIAFEVLRHATPQEQKWIKAQFETLPLLPTPDHLWRDATRLGQQCRAAGFNAGSLDLIIAALSIHHDAELITFDAATSPSPASRNSASNTSPAIHPNSHTISLSRCIGMRHQIGWRRFVQEMKVITHEHPGMHAPTATAARFSQPAQENQPVAVILKHGFPAVAPGHHMINRTRILETPQSCHAPPKPAHPTESSLFVLLRELTPETGTDPRDVTPTPPWMTPETRDSDPRDFIK